MQKALIGVVAALVWGCAADPEVKPWWTLNEKSFEAIKPGMSKAEVQNQVGKPLLATTFPNISEEVWDYRNLGGTRKYITEVHFDSRSGTVKYYTQYLDPAHRNK